MLAKILKVKPQTLDTYLVQKENHRGLSWNILRDFVRGHLYDEDSMVAFALSIYGLVIFSGMLGYIEMVVVDTFEQIQHNSNPSPDILAKTFQLLNYCRRNHERLFWDVHLYCIYGSRVISCVKESPSQSPTFQGRLDRKSTRLNSSHRP